MGPSNSSGTGLLVPLDEGISIASGLRVLLVEVVEAAMLKYL